MLDEVIGGGGDLSNTERRDCESNHGCFTIFPTAKQRIRASVKGQVERN